MKIRLVLVFSVLISVGCEKPAEETSTPTTTSVQDSKLYGTWKLDSVLSKVGFSIYN